VPNAPNRPEALDPEALSRLAGGLAHELKNPLSTLALHLALLREEWTGEEGPKPHRTVRTLDTLEQEVGRLNDILEDFLRFARTDEIEPVAASLNQLVESVVSFFRPEALAQGVQIETFLDLEEPELMLDCGRFKQVILNLLINARQAMTGREHGLITVITRPDSAAGHGWMLEVLDDGPGMSTETLDHCFDTYFSSKKGGSGLGLALVKRVVEAHDGQIEIQSSPGHGTRVMIRLPRAKGSSSSS
jgi:signal transduction histidine kinase